MYKHTQNYLYHHIYTHARGLQFIDDYGLNLHGKYSPLAAMLLCPVTMIFYINFFGDYNLKMSKIDWLFLTSTEVGGHIVYVISA